MAAMTRWGTAAVLAATLGPADGAAAGPPDLVVKTRTFLEGPGVVDPRGESYVYTPTAPQNGRLMVFFPGSSLGRYKSFMTTAAAHGYHVLGLDAPGGEEDSVHRLVAILEYLKEERQGSGQFLLCRDAEPCAPDWPKIVVAGHAQGGVVALGLLKRHHGTGMKAILFSGSDPALREIPRDLAWKDDVYSLDNAADPRYTATGGLGELLGRAAMSIPGGITYPACAPLPAGRFLVDPSPGGDKATLEDGDATDAARCAWDRFLTLY
jgi:hypothetical protein